MKWELNRFNDCIVSDGKIICEKPHGVSEEEFMPIAKLIAAAPELIKAQKLLESLTPGGSEFVNDPEYCVRYVKEFEVDQHKKIMSLIGEKNELVYQNNQLRKILQDAKEVLLQLDHRHNGKCYNPVSESCNCTLCKIDQVLNKA